MSMTDQEINLAIAEACGFSDCHVSVWDCDLGSEAVGKDDRGWYPKHKGQYVRIPSYCTDLNEMHEAEKVLSPEQEVDYVERLGAMLMSCAYEDDPRWRNSELSSFDSTYRATARQRAEALLHTLGKWRDP